MHIFSEVQKSQTPVKNSSILYSFQFDNEKVNNKLSYLHEKFI